MLLLVVKQKRDKHIKKSTTFVVLLLFEKPATLSSGPSPCTLFDFLLSVEKSKKHLAKDKV